MSKEVRVYESSELIVDAVNLANADIRLVTELVKRSGLLSEVRGFVSKLFMNKQRRQQFEQLRLEISKDRMNHYRTLLHKAHSREIEQVNNGILMEKFEELPELIAAQKHAVQLLRNYVDEAYEIRANSLMRNVLYTRKAFAEIPRLAEETERALADDFLGSVKKVSQNHDTITNLDKYLFQYLTDDFKSYNTPLAEVLYEKLMLEEFNFS